MQNPIDDTQETPGFFELIEDMKKRADAISENEVKELL